MRQQKLKELVEEGERIREELDIIAFINGMKDDELDQFWTAIRQFADNEIEIGRFCN